MCMQPWMPSWPGCGCAADPVQHFPSRCVSEWWKRRRWTGKPCSLGRCPFRHIECGASLSRGRSCVVARSNEISASIIGRTLVNHEYTHRNLHAIRLRDNVRLSSGGQSAACIVHRRLISSVCNHVWLHSCPGCSAQVPSLDPM